MLSKILASISGDLLNKLIGPFTEIFKLYINKQITEEQLRTQLMQVLLTSVTEIEKAHAESIAKTYATFMQTALQSPPLMMLLIVTAYSQLVVLLWHQIGIPALCYFIGTKSCWPSSGTTVDWSYALLAGILGFGVVLQRMGPAKLDVDKLRSAIEQRRG
jgi:hypothetical protein